MKKYFSKIFKLNVLFLIAFAVNASVAQDLKYGDLINLQNAWNNYGGGFLDTKGYQKDFEKTGNFLNVSTALSADRTSGSGSWRVMSATGKPEGTSVLVNDEIHLMNQWNGNGGYLDTRGYQKDFEKTGNHLNVSTATIAKRDGGSGTWRILSATRLPSGTPVKVNSEIHLQNAWNNYDGGFLDTRGYQKDFEKTGNHLCVSTALSANRDNGNSGTWKVVITSSDTTSKNILLAGETLQAGEMLTSVNGKYILAMQDDGNLCVYNYANGKAGSFVWGSMKFGFNNPKLIMQTDGNLVVYNQSNQPQWNSATHPTFDARFRNTANKPVKCVLENDGSLNLYSASNVIVWSSSKEPEVSIVETVAVANVETKLLDDVTIETYGIFGKGRGDASSYYYLQLEGNDLAKIKTFAQGGNGLINVEREGNYVYFKVSGTNKYLTFTTNSQVKWLEGKSDNGKWKEIDPIQSNAGGIWKSYVLAKDESLYLRHTGFVLYAHKRANNAVFYGDATWRIEGGKLRVSEKEVPAGTVEAYGKKKMQTFAVNNKSINNFFAGIDPNGKLKIIDVANPNSGKIFDLEVRFKSSSKSTILIDGFTGKYVTADANGNISLTTDEQPGSLWEVGAPTQDGLDGSWFSLKSKHPSLTNHFLRHTGYILFAHKPGTVAAQYFKGDASWKLIERE